MKDNCVNTKKSKLSPVNQLVAMSSTAFHRWNIQQTGKVCELVVSKFQIAEELTEANYLEKLERVAM